MKIDTAENLELGLKVHWQNHSHTEYPYIWLRDNDPHELHPQTQERTFDLTSVPIDIRPTALNVDTDNVTIEWPNKATPSHYTADWLYRHRPGQRRQDRSKVARTGWNAAQMRTLPRANAQACKTSEAALLDALITLKRYGILIVDHLDDERNSGLEFGDLIGFKRQTNFGTSFEVVNMPAPNNLAYTSMALPLHTDLANQEQVPGVQFLHCYKNSAAGGQSTFTDALKVVQDLQQEDPTAYKTLCEVSVPWRFHDETCDLRQHRPVINFNADGEFTMLVLNPHLADVPDMPPEVLYSFYKAYQTLMRRTRNDRYVIRYSLNAGEMAIFDNQRLMHGRTEFDPSSGERHLQGYYIEHNEIDSLIRMLNK